MEVLACFGNAAITIGIIHLIIGFSCVNVLCCLNISLTSRLFCFVSVTRSGNLIVLIIGFTRKAINNEEIRNK